MELKFEYILKESSRAKNICIRFREDKIIVTKPRYISKKAVEKVLKEKEAKILKIYSKVSKNNKVKRFRENMDIYFFGEVYKLKIIYDSNADLSIFLDEENKICIYNCNNEEKAEDKFKELLKEAYKEKLEPYILERVKYYEKITGLKAGKVTIRYTTSRFGSCNIKSHNLSFSSRLCAFEKDIIDSVIVHELAHIKYPNHQKSFYNLVLKYCPNYFELDKKLKEMSKIIVI